MNYCQKEEFLSKLVHRDLGDDDDYAGRRKTRPNDVGINSQKLLNN